MMAEAISASRISDLLCLLGRLGTLHDELLSLAREKIDAMKKSDVGRMRTLGMQEEQVVGRINEREGLRRRLMDTIGEQLNLSPKEARSVSISQLAKHTPEPQKEALLAARDSLREKITQVGEANRTAGVIAHTVVNHLNWVFAAVKPRSETQGYSGQGAVVASSRTAIVDTVG